MNKEKYCHDPRGKHKKRIFKGVRNVTENISSLVKGKLNVNSLLCTNCINDINKDPESFLSQIICPTSLNESSEDISSTSSICTSSTDADIPEIRKLNAENILAFSGVSPVKTSKKDTTYPLISKL